RLRYARGPARTRPVAERRPPALRGRSCGSWPHPRAGRPPGRDPLAPAHGNARMSRTGPSGSARGPDDEERSKVGLGEHGLPATDPAGSVPLAAVMTHATDAASREERHGAFPAGETPLRDRPAEDAPTFMDETERSSGRGGTSRPRRGTRVEEQRSSPSPGGG